MSEQEITNFDVDIPSVDYMSIKKQAHGKKSTFKYACFVTHVYTHVYTVYSCILNYTYD